MFCLPQAARRTHLVQFTAHLNFERLWNPGGSYVNNLLMKLTREEVAKAALLARLHLTSEEQEQLTGQLDKILQYMEKLDQLNTANIEPFTHAVDTVNALREDKVINQPEVDALLANAPERDGGFFKVPKILE
jgi:aspartyl-tRNA(Asn)/glutamyl-tRNA(Gln) amidotransferase subunit C